MDQLVEAVHVGGRTVVVERPADPEALIDALETLDDDERIPYWAELWPASLALAEAVVERPPRGRRVLELGCGLGLPAVVAALEGAAEVTACDWEAEAVAAARRNARHNGVAVAGLVASWLEPEALLARAPWDLVLAADVLYERRNVEPVLALLPRLLAPGGEAWVADPGRRTAQDALASMTPLRRAVWRAARG